MIEKLYHYRAEIKRVVDGDTIICDIDLGFNTILIDVNCRLLGYQAPEKRGNEKALGLQALAYLQCLLPVGRKFFLNTIEKDAFGRWLVNIQLTDGRELVPWLIQEGWGVDWDGKGSRPLFSEITENDYPIKPKK